MNDKKISSLQLSSLVLMIIMSTFLGIGTYTAIKTSGVNSYLNPIFAFIIFIPLLFVYNTINNYRETCNINQKNIYLFGKFFGTILNIIIVILISLIGISLFYNLMTFIESQFLAETPILFIGIIFSIIIIYFNTKEIDVFAKICFILVIINIILYVGAVLSLIPNVDLNELKPFLEHGIKGPIIGGYKLIALNISPMFILLIIPKDKFINKNKYSKYLFYSILLFIIFTVLILSTTIAVSGIDLASIHEYPEYIVLKNINIFNFINRIENIIFIQWIFAIFFTISFVVHYISNTIKYQNKSKALPIIITATLLTTSLILFKDITIYDYYVYNIFPITGTILICVYLFISIVIKLKNRNNT